jgi:hypothetical protein
MHKFLGSDLLFPSKAVRIDKHEKGVNAIRNRDWTMKQKKEDYEKSGIVMNQLFCPRIVIWLWMTKYRFCCKREIVFVLDAT